MGGRPSAEGSPGRPRAAVWASAAVVVGILAACGIVLWLFLSLYASRRYATPIAQDTLKYIWRTRLTEAAGFHAVGQVPAGTTVQPDRPGFPSLAALVHAVTGVGPFRLVFVLAPVAAALIGLAAGALMVRATGEPRWSFPVYVLAVGASVNVVLMAVGYLDNILAAAVLLAAGVAGMLAADGRRGVVATALLLIGAAVIHWQFTALFVAILAGVTALLLPESILARRRGRRWLDTPSARLGAGVLGGAAGVGAVLLTEQIQLSPTSRPSLLHKLHVTEDAYRFGVIGPAAGAGAVAVAVPPRARRLRTLALLLVWGLSALVAYELLEHGDRIAAHRIIGFALAVPILAATTVVGIARALGWLAGLVPGRKATVAARVVAAVVGGALVLGALVASTAVARDEWFARAHPALVASGDPRFAPTEAGALAEAARAGAYVARDGRGLPVIYVVQKPELALAASALGIVRVAIPVDQIPRTALYTGTVQNLLAGRPTLSPVGNRGFDAVSLKFWAGSRGLARRAIVIELRSFDRRLVSGAPDEQPDPGRWIAPGVWLVRGPAPTGPVPDAAPPTAPSPMSLVLTAFGLALLLAVAGSGWSTWLLDDTPARVALAPAFGLAALCVAGVLVDAIGLRLRGGVAVALVVLVAAAGWAWLPVSRRGRARSGVSDPSRPDAPAR